MINMGGKSFHNLQLGLHLLIQQINSLLEAFILHKSSIGAQPDIPREAQRRSGVQASYTHVQLGSVFY